MVVAMLSPGDILRNGILGDGILEDGILEDGILEDTVNCINTTQDRTIRHVEGRRVEDSISGNYPNDLGLLLYGGR